MNSVCAFSLIALILAIPLSSSSAPTSASSDELSRLAEANRLLEEEIKLAARPQVYLVLDLSEQVILIKSRGLELYRLPIIGWEASGQPSVAGLYRLKERPPVARPKATAVEGALPPAIELGAMPEAYELLCDPDLTIAVSPLLYERPWLWVKSLLREWWARASFALRQQVSGRRLRLLLPREAAQSLAWSVTEGMSFLIGGVPSP